MEISLPYDKNDKKSIIKYAERLKGHTLNDFVVSGEMNLENKGCFGQILESGYFLLENNNEPVPDFKEAGLELKSTPMRLLKDGSYSPKERLVLGIINYNDISKESFEKSFMFKNGGLLIIFYAYEEDKNPLDYEILDVIEWRFPAKDIEIIRNDWNIIKRMVLEGRAHEISGGLTFYLEAMTKGMGHGRDFREQPYSDKLAKQRAFGLKSKYLRRIFESRISKQSGESVANASELRDKSIEELILEKFAPYIGLTIEEIIDKTRLPFSKGKSRYALLARSMLGVKGDLIEEFENASVIMRVIRPEHNGRLVESISFPHIRYDEIVHEIWEESTFYETITSKFLFVIFKKKKDGIEHVFEGVKFWTIPEDDLEIVQRVWKDTVEKIRDNSYNNFVRMSENKIVHVRPHARDSSDKCIGPDGNMYLKRSFWLNARYIVETILNPFFKDGDVLIVSKRTSSAKVSESDLNEKNFKKYNKYEDKGYYPNCIDHNSKIKIDKDIHTIDYFYNNSQSDEHSDDSNSDSNFTKKSDKIFCDYFNQFVGMTIEEIIEFLNPGLCFPSEYFSIKFATFCLLSEDLDIYSKFGTGSGHSILEMSGDYITDGINISSNLIEMPSRACNIHTSFKLEPRESLKLIFQKSENGLSHTFRGIKLQSPSDYRIGYTRNVIVNDVSDTDENTYKIIETLKTSIKSPIKEPSSDAYVNPVSNDNAEYNLFSDGTDLHYAKDKSELENKTHQNQNVIKLIQSIGGYCRKSDNYIIKLLPDLLSTISNIFEDTRSDEYVKILCNMSLASFVINSKSDDNSLLKSCFVSLRVIRQLLDTCDANIVYENALSSEFIDRLTLDLNDNISACQNLIDWKDALNEVGFIDFCSFFEDKYDWNAQKDERKSVDKNRVILYVKLVDATQSVEAHEIFGKSQDYANALGHFSERGIFLSESELTPRNYRMLTYMNDGSQESIYAKRSIFEEYILELSTDLSKHFNQTNSEIMKNMFDLVKHFYRPDLDWKNKLLYNSSLAYMISPIRYVSNRRPVYGNRDILAKLLSASLTAVRDSYMCDTNYDALVFYKEIESLDSRVHESIAEDYGTLALFDIMSRQATLSTEKVIDWIYSLKVDDNDKFTYYYYSEGFALLNLARTIDTSRGIIPRYTKPGVIYCSMDNTQLITVKNIEESINNHCLPSISNMRFRNRMKLSSSWIEEDDLYD